ncbi:MAG: 3-deoxy-manno-octulosonate cytidylyltransferase [Bacteroidetes bacterium]|nr:MAG: 3-deoxy-manno-octulosonate cytidylyltransferase [Bacteroidota bacterium]
MKTLGVIPARYASSRFPGKPLIDLKGKTMIQRVYEGASKSDFLDKVIVATDDERIADEVLRFGGFVELTSANHRSGTERCGEVAGRHPEYDVVLNIQGDEPLVDAAQIDSLLAVFQDAETQIASLCIPEKDPEVLSNPNRIKVVLDHQMNAMYFSRSIIPNHQNFSAEPIGFYPYRRHIGLYAYRSEVLHELIKLEATKLEQIESLEQLRWMYYGYRVRMVETNIETPNIDSPEDVNEVLRLID